MRSHLTHQVGRAIVGRTVRCAVNFDKYRILQSVYHQSILDRLCTLNTATSSTRTHLAPKPWITFRGHSRSRILGSLKSRLGTAYYYIIMWSLESEMSKERSEHIRFLEPHCHSATLSIGNPANIRTNVILWKLYTHTPSFSSLIVWMCASIFIRFFVAGSKVECAE